MCVFVCVLNSLNTPHTPLDDLFLLFPIFHFQKSIQYNHLHLQWEHFYGHALTSKLIKPLEYS